MEIVEVKGSATCREVLYGCQKWCYPAYYEMIFPKYTGQNIPVPTAFSSMWCKKFGFVTKIA
jgi:hypothetical protein